VSTIKPLTSVSPTTTGSPVEGPLAVSPGRAAEIASTGAADGTRQVVAAVQSGQLSGADAISRLAAEAAARSGAPMAARAAMEAKLQALLRADPTLGALLAKVGVSD
jgi:hypothetical protein